MLRRFTLLIIIAVLVFAAAANAELNYLASLNAVAAPVTQS